MCVLPLDDVNVLWNRRIDVDRYEVTIEQTFDTLYREGACGAWLLVILRTGSSASRSDRRARQGAGAHPAPGRVWAGTATGEAIGEWYRGTRRVR